MSSNNKKKKLKMERLSPIHHLSNLLNTPVQRVVTQHHQQRDVYAIEITSSPEFIQPPVTAGSSTLKKQGRIRNIARCKVPKKPNSTPLSGLIMRKTVDKAENELHFPDPFNSPTLTDVPSPGEAHLLSIPEELPQIEDNSPQKSTHSPRHSEMISASSIFLQTSQPSTSNTSPLAGIVIKEASNLHHTLNDSILVLREAEDPSDDDEVTSNTCSVNLAETNAEKVSIETFESPRKPHCVLLKELTTAASIFKNFNYHSSKNVISNKPEVLPITVNSSSNSVEICGNVRQNRKRALDFNSPNCIEVLTECGDLGDGRQSPILNLTSSRHDFENLQSPVLNLSPDVDHESEGDQHSPILNFKSQRPDRSDFQSPVLSVKPQKSHILNLLPPGCYEENDSKSPVLNLMTLDHESGGDCLSPTLNFKSPRHDLGCQSSVLKPKVSESSSPMAFCSSKAHFKPLKPAKYQEIKPHVEKQEEECLSDPTTNNSLRPIENRNQDSGILTVPSVNIENDSLSCIRVDYSDDEFDIPRIVEILEDTPTTKGNREFDLKFVVVSHETSSDESVHDEKQVTENSGEVIFPSINSRHSPLDLNITKRPIQSFESPSKVPKPFSEALNIGAFGSPDSNASYEDQLDENKLETDEVIEPSTTQEYIEESEQIRPTKRRKKGSLLERVKSVIAKVDASNTLFDYEIKCGLRLHEGKFVSAPMVILKKSPESASLFLICKPLKYCVNSSHVDDISSYVILHVNKLPCGICDGSVVRLHFPMNVVYFSNLHIPCALAGHQIVKDPTNQKIDVRTIDASSLESINSISLAYNKPMTAFRTFSSIQLRTLSEAALCQNLVEGNNLYLTVLHVTKLYVEAVVKKISVLCWDEEHQFCWLEFSSKHDIKRAGALEILHILADGSHVQTKGFSVTNRVRLDRKSKHLVSYCSNNAVNNDVIFSVHPNEPNWIISSTDGLREVKKVRSSVEDILFKKIFGCRYLLEVHDIEKESPIKLKDFKGQSINFVVGGNSYVNLDHSVPFFLDGVYFFDDKLFSDEHTRTIPIV